VASPTGEQFVLTRSDGGVESRAIITQVAAALRTLTVGGENLTEPYDETVPTPGANGIVLVPWPNRVDDGMWILDGKPQNLDISEPRHHNAIHGLLRWTPYSLVSREEGAVTLAATVFPQHGYPFQLETRVTYELVGDGIAVTHVIRNVGADRAPVAIGAHPYLRVGDAPVDSLTLTVDATSRFSATQRMIPFVEMPVHASDYDLRHGRVLGGLRLDDAYADLTHVDGIATHRLEAPDGRAVELWQDENFRYVQVFTPRNYQRATAPGLAIALEPMTAPPNALVTKRDLRWLDSGEEWTARWGIRYRGRSDD
jgi:aldose 1-epimerase